MKRLSVLMAAILVLSISACSSENSPSKESNNEVAQEVTTEEEATQETDSNDSATVKEEPTGKGSSLFAGAEWVENETTSGVPVPSFSVPAESVDVSESEHISDVAGNWVNVPDDEIIEYIQAVKDAGFTYNANEMSTERIYEYSANNAEITFNSDYKSVSITLQSTNSTSGENSDTNLRIRVVYYHFE